MSKAEIIYNDFGDAIGFYESVRKFLIGGVEDYLACDDFERAKDLCELLEDARKWEDSSKLLIVKTNNGMGLTIGEFKND